jgi:hypothetical protein
LAIVRTQTACELYIAETLTHLLHDQHPHADPTKLIRRPTSLRDNGSLALLHLLTGRRIQDAPWWSQYIDHVKRRNEVLHAGVAVTRDDAFESLGVGIELHRWLLHARGVDTEDETIR